MTVIRSGSNLVRLYILGINQFGARICFITTYRKHLHSMAGGAHMLFLSLQKNICILNVLVWCQEFYCADEGVCWAFIFPI